MPQSGTLQFKTKPGADDVAESLVSTPEAEGETVATFQFHLKQRSVIKY